MILLKLKRLFASPLLKQHTSNTASISPSASESPTESLGFGNWVDATLACSLSEKCTFQTLSCWAIFTGVFYISEANWCYQGLRNASPATWVC